MSAATAEVEGTETVTIPPGERKAINSMADKFKAAMAQVATAPAAPAAPAKPPAPAPPKESPTKPAEPPKIAGSTPEKPGAEPQTAPAATSPEKPAEQKPENLKHANFKALEQSRDQYKAEAEALKAAAAERDQLKAELEAARKGSAEYEEAKKKLVEHDAIIKQFYVENDPQFQAHFTQKFQNALLAAKRAVGSENIAKIEAAFQIPASRHRDEQVAALAEGLNDFDRGRLVKAYADLEATEVEKSEELKRSRENFQKLQELNAQRMKEEQDKETTRKNTLLTAVMGKVEGELAGADEETAKVIKDRTRKVIEWSAGPDEITAVLVDAARAKASDTRIKEYAEKVEKLEAQIAELQGANPQLGSSAEVPAKVKVPQKPSDFEPIGQVFRREREKLTATARKQGKE